MANIRTLNMSVLLLFACAIRSAEPPIPKAKSDVLFRSLNAKYHLSCTFHGKKVRLAPGDDLEEIQYLTISDSRTRVAVRFKPIDPATLQSARAFYKNVWSPDQEWLVLPLGKFEGFQLVHSPGAIKELRSPKPADFIRVEMPNGTALAHEFSGWTAPNSFTFRVGLSGDHWDFLFNLSDHSIRALDAIGGIAVTPKGNVQIPNGPGSPTPKHDPNLQNGDRRHYRG